MLGRMAGGGVAEQRDASFDRGRHAGTPVPPSPFLAAPPKLLLADGSGVVSGVSPVPVEAAAVMSPTSILQAAAGSPTAYPAAAAVAFSHHGASSSSSGGDRHRCNMGKSRGCHRRPAWEAARHAGGLGLAVALNAGDAVPPSSTVLRAGQSLRSPALGADRSARSPLMMSPREMAEASEDYTRVIARGGPNPRTTHIFYDDRVVVDGCGVGGAGGEEEDGFLRWCHGCSKELGHGKDIFMYRGEMAFCSHECRYGEMLLFDEES